jgi:hypothetical protein
MLANIDPRGTEIAHIPNKRLVIAQIVSLTWSNDKSLDVGETDQLAIKLMPIICRAPIQNMIRPIFLVYPVEVI